MISWEPRGSYFGPEYAPLSESIDWNEVIFEGQSYGFTFNPLNNHFEVAISLRDLIPEHNYTFTVNVTIKATPSVTLTTIVEPNPFRFSASDIPNSGNSDIVSIEAGINSYGTVNVGFLRNVRPSWSDDYPPAGTASLILNPCSTDPDHLETAIPIPLYEVDPLQDSGLGYCSFIMGWDSITNTFVKPGNYLIGTENQLPQEVWDTPYPALLEVGSATYSIPANSLEYGTSFLNWGYPEPASSTCANSHYND